MPEPDLKILSFMKIDYSYISNANPAYIEGLYDLWLRDSNSVDAEWSRFFQGFHFGQNKERTSLNTTDHSKEISVVTLIESYRQRGHLLADTNPIRPRKDRKAELQIEDFGLSESDLEKVFQSTKIIQREELKLKDLVEKLRQIYCGKIGFEFHYIEDQNKRRWLQNRIETRSLNSDFGLSLDQKKQILKDLNGSVIFEKFLHTKYVGQKRFSLEGGESTIPALESIIQKASELGTEEVVIGMAHRGRLNVLANIMGKTYEQIFSEFEGTAIPDLSFGSGDVKYHLGYSSQIATRNGKTVQLKLAPNPSHLESVDPVVQGIARAKADLLYQSDYDKILTILIHGDAALAGQGVVYETLQMSGLEGYYTGGTIHFVINNQIGFTTDFEDARSSTYSTSMASSLQAPVFHVNGDDPEAVVFASELAIQYRQEFNSDVFIDMVCYRRHGHNEGDDPKFTQPKMYQIIQEHPNVREIYMRTLQQREEIEKKLAEQMELEFWGLLQDRLNLAKEKPLPYYYQDPELAWRNLKKNVRSLESIPIPSTGIAIHKLKSLQDRVTMIPPHFNPLPKIKKIIQGWKKMADADKFDWSMAEMLAYATILDEGIPVRLSGQDVKRGTFSHRHAVLFDEKNNQEYSRLENLHKDQGRFFIYNSLLSEFAVLGFEYGYSLASPKQLVLWEAQFGDFANGAQVIFDQYISSAELKWNRMSGLVVLLPHGYDGQGPEHSSARLERFLQNCAEFNMIVANISSPANYFHLLRRQLAFDFRKPLIVMSPKSLFRHPECMSKIEEFLEGTTFQEVLVDPVPAGVKIQTLIFCTGQIYYEIKNTLTKNETFDVLVVRIEQLYPFPEKQIEEILKKHSECNCIWFQEEPLNMGAAAMIDRVWPGKKNIRIVSRTASASPAVGHKKIHDQQHVELMKILEQKNWK